MIFCLSLLILLKFSLGILYNAPKSSMLPVTFGSSEMTKLRIASFLLLKSIYCMKKLSSLGNSKTEYIMMSVNDGHCRYL